MLPTHHPVYPDDAIRAEYDEMAELINVIVEIARVIPSMNFYP